MEENENWINSTFVMLTHRSGFLDEEVFMVFMLNSS